MPRFALAVVLLAAVAVAAPVPKAKKVAPYPHAVGTKWEYTRDGDEKEVWTEEVTESDEKDGVITFKVEITMGCGEKLWEKYRLKGDEVHYTESNEGALSEPMILRKGDYKEGDEWTCKYTQDGVEYEESVTIGKQEELTTPAGKYKAWPVVRKFAKPEGARTMTFWYADGVGLVRQTTDGTKEPRQELKAFTDGKKK